MAERPITGERPVRIINFEVDAEKNDKKISLCEDSLKAIFEDGAVKDLPIVVLSVAGAYRTGKSFLLNFCLRYLRHMSTPRDCDQNWMGCESEPLTGFGWSYGPKCVTSGIMVWPQPFIINANDRKMAVYLMDTQGIFDNNSTERESMCIFSLSTLLSSIHVYNVFKQIQADYLRNMMVFTEFATKAKEDSSGSVFQKLVFLVRDWQYPDTHSFGSGGGEEHLKATYRELEDSKNAEGGLFSRKIRAMYEPITCFLLPQPGDCVQKASYDGNLSDLRSDFKRDVKDLVELLLAPENLVAKKIGHELTAGTWATLLRRYVEILNTTDKNDVTSALCSVSAELAHEVAISDVLELYNKKMEYLASATSEALRERHSLSKTEAVSVFQGKRLFGGHELTKKFVGKLEREIEQKFQHFQAINWNRALSSVKPLTLLELRDNAMHIVQETCDKICKTEPERPKLLISVAGPPCKRKTNLLNFFLRYFQCLDDELWLSNPNGDWMTREGLRLVGFEEEIETAKSGITIWPQAFSTGPDNKTLVYVMNVTQRPADTAPLVTLGSVISSVQITMGSKDMIAKLQEGLSIHGYSLNRKGIRGRDFLLSFHMIIPKEIVSHLSKIANVMMNTPDGISTEDVTDREDFFTKPLVFDHLKEEQFTAGFHLYFLRCYLEKVSSVKKPEKKSSVAKKEASAKMQQVVLPKANQLTGRMKSPQLTSSAKQRPLTAAFKPPPAASLQVKAKLDGFVESQPPAFECRITDNSSTSEYNVVFSMLVDGCVQAAFETALKFYSAQGTACLDSLNLHLEIQIQILDEYNEMLQWFLEELTHGSELFEALIETILLESQKKLIQALDNYYRYRMAYYCCRRLESVKPVTIVGFENDALVAHHNALENMINRLDSRTRGLPIVVLSVAGPARRGKSFILNFCLRYLLTLETEGVVGDDWLGPEDVPLSGFEWRNSTEGVTSGIVMWPEPFIIKRDSGEKVAVFLMDTQGTFDNQRSTGDTSAVFTLSTLMSSVLVNNLTHQIQSDDLQNLSVFTNYAQLSNDNEAMQRFQKLMFLVRNWQNPGEYPYGIEGGKRYLEEKILNIVPGRDVGGLREVKEQIRAAFEDVECFLMPFPGVKVASRKQFDGHLSDIEDDFKSELKELIPYLLSPSLLEVKKFENKFVTVTQWHDHIKPYFAAIEAQGPKNFSIYEVQAEIQHNKAEELAMKAYGEVMKAIDDGDAKYLPPKELETLHLIGLETAMITFERAPKLGRPTYINQRKITLDEKLGREYECVKLKNHQRKTWKDTFQRILPFLIGAATTVAVLGIGACVISALGGPAAALAAVRGLSSADTLAGVATTGARGAGGLAAVLAFIRKFRQF